MALSVRIIPLHTSTRAALAKVESLRRPVGSHISGNIRYVSVLIEICQLLGAVSTLSSFPVPREGIVTVRHSPIGNRYST